MSHLKFDDMQIEIISSKTFNTNKEKTNNKNQAQKRNDIVPLTPMPKDLVKPLDTNLQLSILIDRRNTKWRSIFEEKISTNYGSMSFERNHLIIKCTLDKKSKDYNQLADNWDRKMNSLISSFACQFTMDSFNLDDHELSSIKDSIRRFNERNGFSIDYRVFKKRLFYVIKKNQLVEFQNSIQDNAHEKCKNLDYFIPSLPDSDYNFLIKPLIDRLKYKYPDIESVAYDMETQNVQLRGPAKRLDEILIYISDSVSSIRCEKLNSICEEAINCANLKIILEKIIDEKKLTCKMSKKSDGIYLIYFLQKTESSFSILENHILRNYTSTLLDISKSSNVLNDVKWSEFKNKNLITSDEFTFSILNSKDLVIFGKKEIVFELEIKLQEFFANNKNEKQTLSKKIESSHDEVIFKTLFNASKELNIFQKKKN